VSNSLRCPWAENHINVSTSGNISTCCLSVPVVDSKTNEPYNIRTHTISEAFSSNEFELIRSNLRNGIKDSQCDFCWNLEDLGSRSIRTEIIEEYERRTIPVIDSALLHMNLDLSNQCNLKCRTCGPSDSSAWVEEHKNVYFVEKENIKTKNNIISEDTFFDDLEKNIIPTLIHLHFMGGEPFLIKQQWRLIDSIIQSGYNKNLMVSYHTNGTVWNNKISDSLTKFKKVQIALSIDDIEERFEYLRYPAKWSEVYQNLLSIKEWVTQDPEHREFIINCTVSIFNILTISDILEFCKKESIAIFLRPVTRPSHFSIVNIPDELKPFFIKFLSFTINDQIDFEVENLKFMLSSSTSNLEQWKNFLTVTELHDNYRKENWKQTFLDMYEVVKQYV
jgi:sulfatase maturation enzyme AslB (radical SAM superfamily)